MGEMDLFAIAARDAAIERARRGSSAAWIEAANAAVRGLARRGMPFTADDVWELCAPGTREPRALGSVMMRAAKSGIIRKVGYVQSRRASRHCGPVAQWVGVSRA